MPFDYMIPKVNRQFLKKLEGRPQELGRLEVEQRANLFCRLNYPRAYAVRRIMDNIAWEFELSKLPAFHKEVREIVDGVYKNASRGA